MSEVLADAAHRTRAEGLDAGSLERVEDGARINVHRRIPRVDPRIMVTQAKRGGIRRTARFGDELRLKRRPGRRDARGLPRRRGDIGREYDLHLGIVRDRAAGAGQDPAEDIDFLGHARGLC